MILHVILTAEELSTARDTKKVDNNPYAFIRANMFNMPKSTTVEPFRNNTPKISAPIGAATDDELSPALGTTPADELESGFALMPVVGAPLGHFEL
ncbi:hypothetical protein CQW23_00922 [Capsicum baccatum]|uniref:Uncharacterized protein n=1 Tax=Capsicum baccatum TaxID=33114 RepID=A0A2G2XM78_CAPBA|nr:hypothetical protein CQW23_00922 [Capsicum baccatum]